jgi:hypothetical protein
MSERHVLAGERVVLWGTPTQVTATILCIFPHESQHTVGCAYAIQRDDQEVPTSAWERELVPVAEEEE